MKKAFYKYFFIAFLVFGMQHIQAQDPNWTVNTANFQFSMTITTFLNVDGVVLTSANDKVAAYVNGEIRGVSNVIFVSSANKYVSYLTVFANTDKETINFKIYNSATDAVVNIAKTETFTIDGNLGGIFQSYSLANPALSNEAVFNSFEFLGITSIETSISSDKIKIVLPKGTNSATLKSVFSSSANLKVYVENVNQNSGNTIQDFTNPIIYKVLSESEAVFKEYEVSVKIAKNDKPTTVVISNTSNLNTNVVPIPVKIKFSNSVSGFDISDVILENAIVSSFSKIDSENYNLEVIPLSQGDLSVQISENRTLDEDNNQNKISNKIVFNYDVLKPLISNISVVSDLTSWWFLVTFSEDVSSVDKTDFFLKGLASIGVAISGIEAISASNYKVKINNLNTEIGTISLQLNSASNIIDKNNNKIVISDFNGYFLKNEVLALENSISSDILISPNPVVTNLKVSLKEGELVSATLYDLNGKKLFSEKSNQKEMIINLETIKNGIYFLKIISTRGAELKKILKI